MVMKIVENKNTNSLVDLSYLNQVCDGDQDFIGSIVGTFIEDAPIILNRLSEHITNANWKQVSLDAHQLKPSLQFIGLKRTLDEIKIIEQRSKQQTELESISVLANSVQHDINQAIMELKKLYN